MASGIDPYKKSITDSKKLITSWTNQVFAKPGELVKSGEGIYIEASRNVVKLNRTVWDTPLKLGDTVFPHGIYMDTPAAVRVRLPKPAFEFTAKIGIDNNSDTQSLPQVGSARFHILVDGNRIYTSQILKLPDGQTPVHIPLNGAKEFVLEVDDASDGVSCDQCDWADASVKFADGTTLLLDELGLKIGTSGKKVSPPYSFTYDSKRSESFLDEWEFNTSEKKIHGGKILTNTYRDPKTGLLIECDITSWDDCAIADWVFHLTNTGTT
ncbi:MAG: NPCBM/NEW2 domain-containing protein, partial [Armatimonadota bacterium]